jgi:hypothetical protein
MFNTEAEKMWQYKDLTVEKQCMWNVKTKRDTFHSRHNWNHLKIIKKITLMFVITLSYSLVQ